MIFWRAVRVALVLPAVVSAPSAAGQDRGATVIIPEDVSCARCSIALQRLTTVGDSAGPGMLAQQGTVVVDTRGRVFLPTRRVVASTRVPQRLLGFAGDGVAASYEEDADGNPRCAIWRLVLRDP